MSSGPSRSLTRATKPPGSIHRARIASVRPSCISLTWVGNRGSRAQGSLRWRIQEGTSFQSESVQRLFMAGNELRQPTSSGCSWFPNKTIFKTGAGVPTGEGNVATAALGC